RPLPPPGQAHTALPTDTTTDLHTLRAAISDLRGDLDRPAEPDLRFRAGMDSRTAALASRATRSPSLEEDTGARDQGGPSQRSPEEPAPRIGNRRPPAPERARSGSNTDRRPAPARTAERDVRREDRHRDGPDL
ncbi:MAG: hypothetical protein L0K74_11765, partial [Acidipropionibacterium acidipropionici]|nr:hypothetical protein [Acidipropionibacterium acidipropionici]